ncbi:bifunctional 5,10-methylenetetrahydrofolate dehydrogenase/5,10-methenyltetrahydrofolate cyclohydrolase [Candidatus Gottesmanbacteria bacterium]|nr:bifunctional 5,10-methylenetetrahydrofolate dehydrogenase/5,10-methenyltetrahydrofolate cyclohydrolase [Candidatus Gottesmanbacteria bacterium]
MIIYGKEIADIVYKKLIPQINLLKKRGIISTLAIILVGNNPQSFSYVKAKKRAGERIGINVVVNHINNATTLNRLKQIVDKYNNDKSFHGVIIQLPVEGVDSKKAASLVVSRKDVDAFTKKTIFAPPITQSVMAILKYIHKNHVKTSIFLTWLKSQQIAVIGKGFTAGEPIFNQIFKINKKVKRIDHNTKNPDLLIKSSDIVISCAGSKNIVNSKNCKRGAILIGVGLHREDGVLKSDYNPDDIEDIAGYYTPTPKGVGPINVAYLLKNVVLSAGLLN